MFYYFDYKQYKGSKRATDISYFAGIAKTLGLMFTFGSIYLFIVRHFYRNGAYCLGGGLILLGIYYLLNKEAEKISKEDFEKKLAHDLEFAKEIVSENPDSKEYVMSVNYDYKNYILGNE